MRELNVCEVGAVAGGRNVELWGAIAREIGIGLAIEGIANAISYGWNWWNTPTPTYGNGNGATGPGYSGAGIGGNVSPGSSGSSHFG